MNICVDIMHTSFNSIIFYSITSTLYVLIQSYYIGYRASLARRRIMFAVYDNVIAQCAHLKKKHTKIPHHTIPFHSIALHCSALHCIA